MKTETPGLSRRRSSGLLQAAIPFVFWLYHTSTAYGQKHLAIGLWGGAERLVFNQQSRKEVVPSGWGSDLGGRVSFRFTPAVYISWGVNVGHCRVKETEMYPGVINPVGLERQTTGTLTRIELEIGLGGSLYRTEKYEILLYGGIEAIEWVSYSGDVTNLPSGSSESFHRDLGGERSDIAMKLSARFMRHIARTIWIGLEPYGASVVRDSSGLDVPPGEASRPSVAGLYGCAISIELRFSNDETGK